VEIESGVCGGEVEVDLFLTLPLFLLYFCQCLMCGTVTHPRLASIAAATAVELLVLCYHVSPSHMHAINSDIIYPPHSFVNVIHPPVII
jgi:hypothetical protein